MDGRNLLTDQTALGGFNATPIVLSRVPGNCLAECGPPTYWSGIFTWRSLGRRRYRIVATLVPLDAGGSGMISGSPTRKLQIHLDIFGPTCVDSSADRAIGILWALDNAAPAHLAVFVPGYYTLTTPQSRHAALPQHFTPQGNRDQDADREVPCPLAQRKVLIRRTDHAYGLRLLP